MEEKDFEKDIEKNVGKKIEACCENWGKDKTCGGFGYFLGVVGAAVYYISTSAGFWAGVLGVLKAMVWPTFWFLRCLSFWALKICSYRRYLSRRCR